MTDQTPVPLIYKEPRLYGVVDVLRPDRVAGWVIDRTDAARCATVELRREGRLVATVPANRSRKDLERQAVGTGRYGFAIPLDPPLDEGMEFTISVTARSHDGQELSLQPAASAARTISPEKKALARVLAELSAVRADIDAARRDFAAAEGDRARFQERAELVQLRLESAIASVDVPQGTSSRWLAGVAVTGAILGLGSMAVGLYSLWGG